MYRTQSASWALAQAVTKTAPVAPVPEGQELLTDREREVLQRMAAGERNAEICPDALCLRGYRQDPCA
jgi:DNA-binding NarL/FixJ family response regulator